MSHRTKSDADLERWVDELKRGIRVAENGEEIYLLVRPWVYGFFKKRLRGSPQELQECEDLTHNVFTKVFGHIGSCNSAQTFRSWLFAITTNTWRTYLGAKNYGRRSAYETSLETLAEHGGEIPDSKQVLVDRSLLQQESEKQVRQVVREMPEHMRRCAELHFFEGYSYKKIAILLRIKESTVRVQVHNARGRLRRQVRSRVSHKKDD